MTRQAHCSVCVSWVTCQGETTTLLGWGSRGPHSHKQGLPPSITLPPPHSHEPLTGSPNHCNLLALLHGPPRQGPDHGTILSLTLTATPHLTAEACATVSPRSTLVRCSSALRSPGPPMPSLALTLGDFNPHRHDLPTLRYPQLPSSVALSASSLIFH